jgi:hypothetical protein
VATYNPTSRRCSLCGQYQITEDREALLEQERFEWDESLVDDFIAGNRHLCFDTDPHGARESERLIEAGEMVPELGWLIALELERRQAAGPAGWVVFMGPATLIAMAPVAADAMACCGATSGPLRAAESRACDQCPRAARAALRPRARSAIPHSQQDGGRTLDHPDRALRAYCVAGVGERDDSTTAATRGPPDLQPLPRSTWGEGQQWPRVAFQPRDTNEC